MGHAATFSNNASTVHFIDGMNHTFREVKKSAEYEHPKSAAYAARPLAA